MMGHQLFARGCSIWLVRRRAVYSSIPAMAVAASNSSLVLTTPGVMGATVALAWPAPATHVATAQLHMLHMLPA